MAFILTVNLIDFFQINAKIQKVPRIQTNINIEQDFTVMPFLMFSVTHVHIIMS